MDKVHPVFKPIFKEFKKVDSSHLATYGHSTVGTIHVWSNNKRTSLCGRKLVDKLKWGRVRGKPLCKSCNKSNRKRYAVLDLLPTIFVTGFIMHLAVAIGEQKEESLEEVQ